MTGAESGFIVEPQLPLPDPETTLAGQLRRRGHTEDEILHIYMQVFAMNRVEASELIAWDSGRPTSDLHFIE